MIKLLLHFYFIIAVLLSDSINRQTNLPESYRDDVIWIDHNKAHTCNAVQNSCISDDADLFTIPLKRAGSLILMEAVIDSIHGNLILDTGSKGMVLNSIYFRHSRRSGGMIAGGITGAAASVGHVNISNLQISDIVFSGLKADITDLGHIENARNTKILGFFGLSLFSEFEVVIDLRSSVMELHRIDYYGNRKNNQPHQHKYDLDLAVRTEQDVMFINANISDRKLTFCLDTGAESNVLSNQLPNRILSNVSIFKRSNLRGVGSQSVEVLYGIMSGFNINGRHFPEMNVIVTNLNSMSEFYNIRIDGMLGCDFFEKGIFSLNLRKKNLRVSLYEEFRK